MSSTARVAVDSLPCICDHNNTLIGPFPTFRPYIGKQLTDLPIVCKGCKFTNPFNNPLTVFGGKYRFFEVRANINTNVNKSMIKIMNY